MARPRLQDEIGKTTPFERPEEEAYLNLIRTAAALGNAVDRLLKPLALSGSTYNVLRILRGHHRRREPGVPCATIVRHLVVPVPDVTRLVDRLIGLGFAARQRDAEDRRVVRVTITPKGLDVLARLDDPIAALHERQLGHLGPTRLKRLNALIVQARTPA